MCLGVLSSQANVEVSLLTRRPEEWSREIRVTDCHGYLYEGVIRHISSNPAEVIPQADIVFLCLPGFAIKGALEEIGPFLSADAVVGTIVSSTGFFFFAHEVLGRDARLFGFQRVPYIARTVTYGRESNLLGYKKQLAIAQENVSDAEQLRQLVETLWKTPTKLLSSFYEAALTNSNPILHTGRLYSLWKDWDGEVYDRIILFYKEWTEDAARVLIEMDAEFMRLLEKLPISERAIPSLLEYYESHDAESLTRKIQSIEAFKTILSPMKKVDGGYIPDFGSRYFTEDFPFGLAFIKQLAAEKGVATPVIDKVYGWGMEVCGH